jgi:hypothetical protein
MEPGVPHVMFFAARDIAASEELTWDYGANYNHAPPSGGDGGSSSDGEGACNDSGDASEVQVVPAAKRLKLGDRGGGRGSSGGGSSSGGDGGGRGGGDRLAAEDCGEGDGGGGGRQKRCLCGAARCVGWLPAS